MNSVGCAVEELIPIHSSVHHMHVYGFSERTSENVEYIWSNEVCANYRVFKNDMKADLPILSLSKEKAK